MTSGDAADSIYRDPEIWGDYAAGFSAPVIVQSIREARRRDIDTRPSAGWFLAACQRNRDHFKQLVEEAETLLRVRYYLEDLPDAPVMPVDDDSDIPF
jgi:hypothetical protein